MLELREIIETGRLVGVALARLVVLLVSRSNTSHALSCQNSSRPSSQLSPNTGIGNRPHQHDSRALLEEVLAVVNLERR